MRRVLSLVLPCCLLAGCHSGDVEKKTVVDVEVQKAMSSDVLLTITAPATIFGRAEARISARITAPVQKLIAHKGDEVKKGQLLAVLDSSDLRAQAADAEATLSSAQASLERTKGGTIPADLIRAHSDLEAKAAALQLAQKVYDKRKGLYEQGAIAERELQTSDADRVQAQANYDIAKKNLDVLEHQTSRSDLRIAEGTVAGSAARKQFAQANLSFTELRSPMNGTVTEQTVYPGDMAKPDVPMFSIVDLSVAIARAQVDADSSGRVRVGQACSFAVKERTGTSSGQLTGRITVVNQAVDPARNTVEVWCQIPNKNRQLKSGLFGSVTIAVGAVHAAVLVPSAAVEFEEGSDKGKVYVVDRDQVAHIRQVEAESGPDGSVRIVSGLVAGEVVIVNGEYGLPDSTQIRVSGSAR